MLGAGVTGPLGGALTLTVTAQRGDPGERTNRGRRGEFSEDLWSLHDHKSSENGSTGGGPAGGGGIGPGPGPRPGRWPRLGPAPGRGPGRGSAVGAAPGRPERSAAVRSLEPRARQPRH